MLSLICQKQKDKYYGPIYMTIWNGWIHKRKDMLQIPGALEEEAMELLLHGQRVSA